MLLISGVAVASAVVNFGFTRKSVCDDDHERVYDVDPSSVWETISSEPVPGDPITSIVIDSPLSVYESESRSGFRDDENDFVAVVSDALLIYGGTGPSV